MAKILKNKLVCYLGDSITEGCGASSGNVYHDLLKRKYKFNCYNFGVNGATSQHVLNQAKKMYDKFGKNVDVISVFIGTNDFYHNTKIGDFFTEKDVEVVAVKDENGNPEKIEKRKKREFVFDTDTFCGRLNTLFCFLKKNYPKATIILMTPIHRAFAEFGNDNIQYDELYSNAIGEYFEKYIDTVRKCADIWSLSLIDLYRESGLFPLFDENAELYFANIKTDHLHPNDFGHKRLADIISRYYELFFK